MQSPTDSQPLPSLTHDERNIDVGESWNQEALSYEKMARVIQKWGAWWIVLGLLSAIPALSVSPSGAAAFLFVGLSSFVFRSPAMLAVFATSMGLAAFFSLMSGSVESIILSLLLVYLCYRAARNFRYYRQIAESNPEVLKSPVTHLPAWKDASKSFPWVSLAMGGVALSAMLALLAGAVFESTQVSALSADPATWEQIYATLFIVLRLAWELGFTYGFASLLARHPLRLVSILGISAAVLSFGSLFLLTLLA